MYRTSERTSLSRKMAELEDRWRKSQEDRYILELKFKEVLKGLADKNEGAKLLRIREKYHHFLENEDRRNQRNDQILRALDKIESQANIFAAKTERLRLLKLHYEAYMKRMYPTWKMSQDGEQPLSSKIREPLYPSHKQRKDVSCNSPRREENIPSNITYHNSPYVDKTPYNSSHVLREKKVGLPVLPNADSAKIPSRQSKSENNRLFDLNRDFTNIDINSKRKSGDSRDSSAEQEENTSKDLLNESLSEDNLINDSTIPVEVRKTEAKTHSESKRSPVEIVNVYEEADRENPRSNVSVDNLNRKHDNNNLVPEREASLFNEAVSIKEEGNDSDFENARSGRKFRNTLSNKQGFERSLRKEDASELRPSVVITQPTPDIGQSSSEEDFNRKEFPSQTYRTAKQRDSSNRETSEAEVSEGERVVSESDDRIEKNSPDKELSPKHFRALDNLGGNVEEPFQFSSSDADYDELENQMAALVERKRNDKSIPKVSGDTENESKNDVAGYEGTQRKSESSLKNDKYNVKSEENNDKSFKDLVLDEDGCEKRIECIESQNVKELAEDVKEDYFKIRKQDEHANLTKLNNKRVKSYDSEKDFEAGSSSMDVNSEILDEDHNLNSDANVYQVEESIQEGNESRNSEVADEEISAVDTKEQKVYEELEDKTNQGNEETNEYYHEKNSPSIKHHEASLDEYGQDVEKEYTKPEEVSNEQGYNNEILEDQEQYEECNNPKYTEDRDETDDNVYEQRDDEQMDTNPERYPELEEAEEEIYKEEKVNEDCNKEIWEENAENKHLQRTIEEEVSNVDDTQQELDEEEGWGNDAHKDEVVNREENVYTHQEVIEIERTDEKEYEREASGEEYEKQGVADDGEYERQDEEEQERENEGQERAEEEGEYEQQDTAQEQREYNTQDIGEDKRQYERQDFAENEYERQSIPRESDEHGYAEEVEGHSIIPEQEERQELEEQENEITKRHSASEEPEEEINYHAIEKQGRERYQREGSMEEERDEVVEQEYDRHEDFISHKTIDDESNELCQEEERKEVYEIQQEIEEGNLTREDEEIYREEEKASKDTAEEKNEPIREENLNQEIVHEDNAYEEDKSDEGRYKEVAEEHQPYENMQESEDIVKEQYGNEISKERQDLMPEITVPEEELLTPESKIIESIGPEHQSSEDILKEEVRYEKEAEEIPEVKQVKTIAEEKLKKDAKVMETSVEVKETKKNPEVQKEKKENVGKETEAAAASSPSVEKHERATKESSPAVSRQSTRQVGKKEYDPHKVEKLKSTIRKFQLKKDNRSDKTGRKGPDSKK